MAKIGSMTINLEAENARLQQDLAKANKALNKYNRDTRKSLNQISRAADTVSTSFKGMAAAVAALGVVQAARGLESLTKSALDMGEGLADLSDRTNVAVETIQALRVAADQNGASMALADDALSRFNRRLGLAAEGGGPAVKMLEALGVTTTNTEAALWQSIDALSGIENAAERSAAASALFGDDAGPKLAQTVALGTDGIEAYRRELEKTGELLSGDMARAAGALSADLRRMGDAIGNAFNVGFLDAFIGKAGDVETSMEDVARAASEIGKALGDAVRWMTDLLGITQEAPAAMLDRVKGELTTAIQDRDQVFARLADERRNVGPAGEILRPLVIDSLERQLGTLDALVETLEGRAAEARALLDAQGAPGVTIPVTGPTGGTGGTGGGLGGGLSDVPKVSAEAKAALDAMLSAWEAQAAAIDHAKPAVHFPPHVARSDRAEALLTEALQ